MKQTRADVVFDIVNLTLITLFFLAVAYPLWFVVIASVSDPNAVNSGQVILWPVDFSLEAYEEVLSAERIWGG